MENKYSKTSEAKLMTCHIDLQIVMRTVLRFFDHTIVTGHREKEAQNKAYDDGLSQLQWPDGNHNDMPSMAVDAAPYIDGLGMIRGNKPADMKYFYAFSHVVITVAKILKAAGIITHDIRWGGDWDSDQNFDDQTFNDLYHYELVV